MTIARAVLVWFVRLGSHSATAIKVGQSIDTSMGLTPLDGLVMGTRSGDLDPPIIEFIAAKDQLCGAGWKLKLTLLGPLKVWIQLRHE